jgi:hypothetical protein
VALGAVGGYALADDDDGGAQTTTVVQTVSAGLPQAVEQTRQEILRAAETRDLDALGRLAAPPFRYTFGEDVPGGPVAHWTELEETTDEQPLETLAEILRMPYALQHGLYVWPFAFVTPPAELTPYERELLAPIADDETIAGWVEFGGYIGWRAGISPAGRWQYYIAGD